MVHPRSCKVPPSSSIGCQEDEVCSGLGEKGYFLWKKERALSNFSSGLISGYARWGDIYIYIYIYRKWLARFFNIITKERLQFKIS
jgi:hypothetical protein